MEIVNILGTKYIENYNQLSRVLSNDPITRFMEILTLIKRSHWDEFEYNLTTKETHSILYDKLFKKIKLPEEINILDNCAPIVANQNRRYLSSRYITNSQPAEPLDILIMMNSHRMSNYKKFLQRFPAKYIIAREVHGDAKMRDKINLLDTIYTVLDNIGYYRDKIHTIRDRYNEMCSSHREFRTKKNRSKLLKKMGYEKIYSNHKNSIKYGKYAFTEVFKRST